MNLYDAWMQALKHTEIIRGRVASLRGDSDTPMPYIFLSESSVNPGDTVVRKGEVKIQQPAILLPPHSPQFEGFELEDFEGEEGSVVNFLLVRGITLPSMKYNNSTSSLEVFDGPLSKAVQYYRDDLARKENIHTGLIIGPDDSWQFSVLLYNCSQVVKNVNQDIEDMFKRYRDKS